MNESSLTFKAFKNSTYNLIGYIWPMIFTLLITPIIVFKLGVKDYGIYLFISTVISMLGLLDLGLGTAVTKHLSFYYGKKDYDSMNRTSHSANSLFLITALIGLALIILISIFGINLLPEKYNAYNQYTALLIIAGFTFFFNTIGSTSFATLMATQRFDISTKISIFSTMISSIGILTIILIGGSLKEIFIFQLFLSAIIAFSYYYQSRKSLPEVYFNLKFDLKEIKNCYSFGVVNFINNIASTSLLSLDRLIIPFFTGPSALTYYSMPGNIATKIPGLSNTLGVSLFPTVSQLSGSEDKEKIISLYIRSFRLITIISSALTITTISFSYKLLQYWLNIDFANNSYQILILLSITNFILSLFGPLSHFLLGLGKLKFLTYSSIGMAIFNTTLLIVLLPRFGIMGAAWSYLISVLPVFYFFYYTETRFLNLKKRGRYYLSIISKALIVSSIVAILNLIMNIFVVNLASLLLIGGTSFTLYILIYKVFGFFEVEDWNDIEKYFFIFIKKIRTITRI